MFQLTQSHFRSNEALELIPTVVRKSTSVRLANPVTFLFTPYNVSEAERSGQPLPENIPPDDNPFSPNRAKSEFDLYACIICVILMIVTILSSSLLYI